MEIYALKQSDCLGSYIKASSADSDKVVRIYPVITSEAQIPVITLSEIVLQGRLFTYEYKSIRRRQMRRWKVYGNDSLLVNQNIGSSIERPDKVADTTSPSGCAELYSSILTKELRVIYEKEILSK